MTYGTTIGDRRKVNLRFSDDTLITLLRTSKEKLLAGSAQTGQRSQQVRKPQKTTIMVADKLGRVGNRTSS